MEKMPDYRMKWIRIWPHAWFDSSMRVELTNAERAFWVDVIALAGKSRIPGVICSDPEGKVGYPLPMLSSLLVSWTPEEVTAILEKLEKTQRVQVKRIPLMSGEDGWIVRVTNWQKYQSEAQRVSKYKKQVYPTTPVGRKDGCTEEEEEVKGEEDSKPLVATATARADSFEAFWESYPRKVHRPEAQRAWAKIIRGDTHLADILEGVERWKKTEQWQDVKFIPHPARFLNQRQWEDQAPQSKIQSEVNVGRGPEPPAPLKELPAKEKRKRMQERISDLRRYIGNSTTSEKMRAKSLHEIAQLEEQLQHGGSTTNPGR